MKNLFLTVAAVAFFGTVSAQDVKFGAKAGVNLSTFTGDLEDTKSKIGFHVGGFVEYGLTEKLFLQPELLFSVQGAKTDYSESESFEGETYSESYEENYKFSYITLPILVKYKITDKFSAAVGPQFGFLVGAKVEYDYSASFMGETESESGEEDIKDSSKSFDFGAAVGVQYDITENIIVQLRGVFGLSNVADVEDDEEDYKVANQVFQLSFGYRF